MNGWSSCRSRSALDGNRALIGQTVELLVATGEGRKDARTARMTGRARDGRLVHFTADERGPARRHRHRGGHRRRAAPSHRRRRHLTHRRTRAGDAHAAGQRPRGVGLGCPVSGSPPGRSNPWVCPMNERSSADFDAFRDRYRGGGTPHRRAKSILAQGLSWSPSWCSCCWDRSSCRTPAMCGAGTCCSAATAPARPRWPCPRGCSPGWRWCSASVSRCWR